MGKLIRFEFRKLFRSKYMYIILGVGLAVTIITIMLTGIMNNILESAGQKTIPYSGYYSAKSALTAAFTTIAGIFLALFAVEDFAQHTNKNIIGRGYKRLELFYSKYIVSLVVIICYAFLSVILSLGVGYLMYGDGGLSVDDNVAVIFLGQLLCVIAYHSFFFSVAYSVGKTGTALAINIVVPMIFELIISIIDLYVKEKSGFILSDYSISGVLINLSSTYTRTEIIPLGLGMLVVYIALFNGLGILVAQKRQF